MSHKLKNSNFVFVCFNLTLAMGWCLFYNSLGPDWTPESLAHTQIKILERELQTQKMARVLSDSRLLDLQVELVQNSSHLPENLAAQYRGFRAPASVPHLDLSGLKFAESKELFSKSRYGKAKEKLEQLIDTYPTSPHVTEAKFLIAECDYRMGDINEGLQATEDMVQLYPESKLSGFLLLKMGEIFRARQETEKANEVVEIIRKNFNDQKELLAAADRITGPNRDAANSARTKIESSAASVMEKTIPPAKSFPIKDENN